MVVIPIAIAAAAAIYLYNTEKRDNPQRLHDRVTSVRQAAGVLGAVVAFVGGLLDALAGISRIFSSARPAIAGRPSLGRTPASDVDD